MLGYIGNTDYDWYRFLLERPDLDEVNFWQPSGGQTFRAIPPGAPFFFKLKKPHYAIGGFGYFAHASSLPLSIAWEAFGDKNGAETYAEMRARVLRYRRDAEARHADPVIGCLMVAQPVFFDVDKWVEQPKDWHRNVVRGATYDLTQGEGERVWRECLARSETLGDVGRIAAGTDVGRDAPRFGSPIAVKPRLGQGTFRVAVLDAYGRSCSVTTEHSLPVLESAHIVPFSEGGGHEVSNGLLLRADIHRLYDRGFVTVTPDLRFRVSRQLRENWHNGRVYYELDGRSVSVPGVDGAKPNPESLEWHSSERFLG